MYRYLHIAPIVSLTLHRTLAVYLYLNFLTDPNVFLSSFACSASEYLFPQVKELFSVLASLFYRLQVNAVVKMNMGQETLSKSNEGGSGGSRKNWGGVNCPSELANTPSSSELKYWTNLLVIKIGKSFIWHFIL